MTVTAEDIKHMRTCASYGKRYHKDVELELDDLMQARNYALVALSRAATGSHKMYEISYEVVDFKAGNVLVLHVSGLVDLVVKELNEFQLNSEG